MIRAGTASRAAATDGLRAVLLLVGLGVAVAGRYLAWTSDALDPVVLGVAFGLALGGLALLDRFAGAQPGPERPAARRAVRAAVIGLGGGLALIGLALAGRLLGGDDGAGLIGLGGAAPALGVSFGPWAVATIVVAGGEEAILRGALLRRLAGVSGIWTAVAVTSLAFALMHLPFYGWRVLPLDFGVGVWLAGLRLESRGLTAPWIAHALADLATWWL